MYIALCLFRDQFSHIKPIERELIDRVKFVYSEQWTTSEIEKVRPHIIIGINEHYSEIAECYAYAKIMGIPTLTLQDGILEWRHMFENPLYDGRTGPPIHAPVLADKIACIGLSSAILIGSLGNWHKVELTGMPKMDGLNFTGSKTFKNRLRYGSKIILVLTSSKPWFTETQKDVVLREMMDLKNTLSQINNLHVVWRVTNELPGYLSVQNTYNEKSTNELGALIESCDAVITTISTTILEAQLLEKPTAILDYFNTPNFVGARWAIRHPSQMESVLTEMLDPTEIDKRIQDYFLFQNITRSECSASQKTAELVLRMIEHYNGNQRTPLPYNILQQSFFSTTLKQHNKDLSLGNTSDQEHESALLKEVISRLKYENQQLKDRLNNQALGRLLQKLYRSITKKNKNR